MSWSIFKDFGQKKTMTGEYQSQSATEQTRRETPSEVNLVIPTLQISHVCVVWYTYSAGTTTSLTGNSSLVCKSDRLREYNGVMYFCVLKSKTIFTLFLVHSIVILSRKKKSRWSSLWPYPHPLSGHIKIGLRLRYCRMILVLIQDVLSK